MFEEFLNWVLGPWYRALGSPRASTRYPAPLLSLEVSSSLILNMFDKMLDSSYIFHIFENINLK